MVDTTIIVSSEIKDMLRIIMRYHNTSSFNKLLFALAKPHIDAIQEYEEQKLKKAEEEDKR